MSWNDEKESKNRVVIGDFEGLKKETIYVPREL
jgi:hypothetical protein